MFIVIEKKYCETSTTETFAHSTFKKKFSWTTKKSSHSRKKELYSTKTRSDNLVNSFKYPVSTTSTSNATIVIAFFVTTNTTTTLEKKISKWQWKKIQSCSEKTIWNWFGKEKKIKNYIHKTTLLNLKLFLICFFTRLRCCRRRPSFFSSSCFLNLHHSFSFPFLCFPKQ